MPPSPLTHHCPRCLAGPHRACRGLRAGSFHFARVKAARQPSRPAPPRGDVPMTDRAYQAIRAEADRRRVPMAWVLTELIEAGTKEPSR
jgi:hypothetical protein